MGITMTVKHVRHQRINARAVANLLQGFSSPADGVHLPANLILLLIGQDVTERPRVRAAVSGARDLRKTHTYD